MKKLLTVLLLTCALVLGLSAELSLPSVLTDHMVLQRDQKVPVWGSASPGSAITVAFSGQQKAATANAEGHWRVDLDPMPANATPQIMTINSSKDDDIEISDILIGEVWLCSGQSNMQMPLRGFNKPCKNADETIASATHPTIRFYKVPHVAAGFPKERINASWTACTPETAATFSAAAFYFGRELQEALDVPVGLLESAWGGTKIEPWTPPCGFKEFASLEEEYQVTQNMPDFASSKKKGLHQTPSAIYNGMIHSLIPFAIKGAIWYQGESNHLARRTHNKPVMLYRDKSEALINGWRSLWGDDFPFYFVQIAPHQYGEEPLLLPEFWEVQAEVAKTVPKTGMVVIHDATTLDDIHPPDKEVPGVRLALLALDHTYGKDVVSAGPTFKDMTVQEGQIKVSFDSAEGLTTRDGKAPDWFEIVGEDGIWKEADAVIKGQSVILRSPEVKQPAAMRFAWHMLATPNLMNAAGLPAVPFRAGEVPEPKQPDMVNLPEMKGFKIACQLLIPDRCGFANRQPEYIVDQRDGIGPFKRIAYLLELQKPGQEIEYAFVSMDAFTANSGQIAVPTAASGARFMQPVSRLTVRSNVDGIHEVTESDGGNIEFWPGNYGPPNAQKVPGASEELWDFGDAGIEKIPGYGCMQVHNWKDQQTVFAFNKWNVGVVDLGIGNSSSHPKTRDWTFADNGGDYQFSRLTVLVK